MSKIIELERKTQELTSDIQDILHAATINFTALHTEATQQSINVLQEEFSYLNSMLSTLQKLVSNRSSLFISYLIIKQIQEEEARVRRERLNEYEQKIYDQKRIITDKQTFFQNLLRPKRKRPSYQTTEEFQQIRARERENEERTKSQQLTKQIVELQTIKKALQDHGLFRKKGQLQHTKSSSISQVSMSLVGEMETVTERIVSIDDHANKENRPTHVRSRSTQNEVNKQHFGTKKQEGQQDTVASKNTVEQIKNLKKKNEQLHKMYDQIKASLNFKRTQCKKMQIHYQIKAQELKEMRKQAHLAQQQVQWRYQRVFSPAKQSSKRSDSK